MLSLAAREHFDPKLQINAFYPFAKVPSLGILNSSTFRPETAWYYTTIQQEGKKVCMLIEITPLL